MKKIVFITILGVACSLSLSAQQELYVSKTSKFNVMQAANFFYETGFFVFAAPCFIALNAFD